MATKKKQDKGTALTRKGAKKTKKKHAKKSAQKAAKAGSRPGCAGCGCDQSAELATTLPVGAPVAEIQGRVTAKRLGRWVWGHKWELLKWLRTLIWLGGILVGVDLSVISAIASLVGHVASQGHAGYELERGNGLRIGPRESVTEH